MYNLSKKADNISNNFSKVKSDKEGVGNNDKSGQQKDIPDTHDSTHSLGFYCYMYTRSITSQAESCEQDIVQYSGNNAGGDSGKGVQWADRGIQG